MCSCVMYKSELWSIKWAVFMIIGSKKTKDQADFKLLIIFRWI